MKIAVRAIALLALGATLIALVPQALATPYWGPREVEDWMHRAHSTGPAPAGPYATGPMRTAWADEFALEASFLNTWQVSNPASPDYGGVIEGEALQTTIQTDNTSESIWVWARYYELTGDNRYHQNILNAFTYSLRNPAYNEEGGNTPTLGYYRMYNCGWAVRAEQKYRDIYHDLTYKTYGDSCASYIAHHTLNRFGNTFYDSLNTHVLAWANGNLYLAGVHENNQTWKDHAVAEGRDKLKAWVQQGPRVLGNQTWAMAGGATMWGLLNSYFRAVPESVATWVPRYKGYMDYFSDPGDFTNAWDGWYAYGHRAVGLALRDPDQLAMHIALTNYLVGEDGDSDGGIPAKPQDTDQMDQTWVSNYMSVFGLSDAFGPLSAADDVSPGAMPAVSVSPNPFTGTTRLSLVLPAAEDLSVAIHDVAGRRIALLAQGTHAAGPHVLEWNADRVPAGVYFARIRTRDGQSSQRLLLVR